MGDAMLFPPTEREAALRDVVAHAERLAKQACAVAREAVECGHEHEGECRECPVHYVWLARDAVNLALKGPARDV